MFKHFKNQNNILPIKPIIGFGSIKKTKSFIRSGRSFIRSFKNPMNSNSHMMVFNSFRVFGGLLCDTDMLCGRYSKDFKLRLKSLMPFSIRNCNTINPRFTRAFKRLLKLYKRKVFRRGSRYYRYKNILKKKRVIFFLFLNKFKKNSSFKHSINKRRSIFKRLLVVKGFVTSSKCTTSIASGKFKFKISKKCSARMKFSNRGRGVCKPVKFVYGRYSTFSKLVGSCIRIRFFLRKYRKAIKRLLRGNSAIKFRNQKNTRVLKRSFSTSSSMEKAGILLRKHTKNPFITPKNRVPYLRSCSNLFKRLFALHLFFKKLSCVNHSILNLNNLTTGNYHGIFMGSLHPLRSVRFLRSTGGARTFSSKSNKIHSLFNKRTPSPYFSIYKLSIGSSCSIVNNTNLLNDKVMSSLDDFKNLFIVKKGKKTGDRMVFGGLKSVYKNTSEVFGFFISKYSRFLLKKRKRKGPARRRFRRRNFFFRDKFRKRFKKSLIGLIFFKNKDYMNDLLEYFFYWNSYKKHSSVLYALKSIFKYNTSRVLGIYNFSGLKATLKGKIKSVGGSKKKKKTWSVGKNSTTYQGSRSYMFNLPFTTQTGMLTLKLYIN